MDIQDYEIDLGKIVESKINKAIENAHPLLYLDHKCKLYVPKIAINYLNKYWKSMSYFNYDNNRLMKYKGYDVIIGYELSIIFVHDDYPIYRKPELISRIDL